MTPSSYLNGLDGPAGDFTSPPDANLPEAVLSFDEARASRFAKSVAGDFNPLHDEGHSRFCVPGDLLFAALVSRYGLRANTNVSFANMLSARAFVRLPADDDESVHLFDERDREVLGWFSRGERIADGDFARQLVLQYVRFSGETFPDILVPMMREANVMVNTKRPLAIYKDMAITLDAAAVLTGIKDGCELLLAPDEHTFSVTDKKGAARLQFKILLNQHVVGEGEKHFVLGGLRPFEEAAIQALVAEYQERKRAWREDEAEAGA